MWPLHRHADAGDAGRARRLLRSGRMLRAADLVDALGQENNPNGKLSPLIPMVKWLRRTVLLLPLGREGQMES